MGSIPLPALDIRPPQAVADPTENYARLLALKQAIQEQPMRQQILSQQAQQGQIQNEIAQRQLNDQKGMDAAMQQWTAKSAPSAGTATAASGTMPTGTTTTPAAAVQPNYDDLLDLARKNNVSFGAYQGLLNQVLGMKEKASTIAKDDATTGNENANRMKTENGQRIDALSGVLNLPDDQLAQGLQSAAQDLASRNLYDPQHVQQAQALAQSGDPATIRHMVSMQVTSMGGFNKMLDDSQKQVEGAQKKLDLQQKQISSFAQQLAMAPDQGTYSQRLGELPYKLASLFPQQFNRQAVLNVGMTPAEQTTAANAQATRQQEQQRIGIEQQRLGLEKQRLGVDQLQSGLTGADFLATLPVGAQAQVKAMANGDIAVPPPGARTPQAMAIRNAVMQYDPTYTDARYKGKQQFKTSGDAQSIMQLSTAMEHADRAITNSANIGFAPALGHPNLESPTTATYMQDIPFLTGEIGKLVKNGELTIDQGDKISSGLTSVRQSVRDASLNETIDLLGGKTRAMFQKYKNATGQDLPVNEFFDAKSQQRLAKYNLIDSAGGEGGSTGNKAGGAPAGATMKVPGSDGKLHWSDGKSDLGVAE